jgi:hypothetical protein
VVVTTGQPAASASSVLPAIPPAMRSGATNTVARP